LNPAALLQALDSFLKDASPLKDEKVFLQGTKGRNGLKDSLAKAEGQAKKSVGEERATHQLSAAQIRAQLTLDSIATAHSGDLEKMRRGTAKVAAGSPDQLPEPCTVKDLALKLQRWVTRNPADKAAASALDFFLQMYKGAGHT
jgi:hypothetical protein